MVTTSCRNSSWVKSSSTESRSSDRKLKPLPPDPFRHQHSAIALRSPVFCCMTLMPIRPSYVSISDQAILIRSLGDEDEITKSAVVTGALSRFLIQTKQTLI